MTQHVRLRAGSALLGAVALGASVLGPMGSAHAGSPPLTLSGHVTFPAGVVGDGDFLTVYNPRGYEIPAADYQVTTVADQTGESFTIRNLPSYLTYHVCVQHFHDPDESNYGPYVIGCYGGETTYDSTDVGTQRSSGLDFSVLPLGSLSGSLTNAPVDTSDPDNPTSFITVQLERAVGDGYDYLTNVGVNPDGTYSLPLPQGDYRISFTDSRSSELGFADQYIDGWDPADGASTTSRHVAAGVNLDLGSTTLLHARMANLTYYEEPDSMPTIDDVAPHVGDVLHASPGRWVAECSHPSFGYAWFAGDDETPVGEGRDLQVTSSMLDSSLTVRVTGTSPDCVRSTSYGVVFSDGTDPVEAAVPTVPTTPTPNPIPAAPAQLAFNGATVAAATGKPTVGGTLSAPSLPLPPNATVGFQWYREMSIRGGGGGGHRVKTIAIGGARGSKYKLKKKDKGTKVFVVETVSAPGYATAKASSKKVRVH